MLRNRYIKWLFILACILFFASCSDDDGGNAYNGVYSDNSQFNQFIQNSSSNGLTYCSTFPSGINAKMRQYVYNGQTYENKVEVKINQNIGLQGKTLEFFRWQQDSSGFSSIDNTPLSFDVNINGNIYTGYTSLTQSSDSSATLSQMVFTIHDLPFSYQALRIRIADSNSGSEILSADGLLPPYKAHPRVYNETHQNQMALRNLHPYKSEAGSSSNEQDFVNRAHSDFCF